MGGLNCSPSPKAAITNGIPTSKIRSLQLLPVAGIVYVIVDTRLVSCFDNNCQ